MDGRCAVLVALVLLAGSAGAQPVVQTSSGPYDRLAAPREQVARDFFQSHADAYDFLIVFPTFPLDFGQSLAGGEVVGLCSRVRTTERGLGIPLVDLGPQFGSPARLRSYIDVKSLGVPPLDVEGDLGVIAHEVLHTWGVNVRYLDGQGVLRDDLTTTESHWSFFFDSNASVQFGADWAPRPPGQFISVGSGLRYSALDLYLMGLVSPSEVAPMTLLAPNTTTSFSTVSFPPPNGTIISAQPNTIRIEDIIAASGPRIPGASASQKEFRAAFIILTRPGQQPTPEQVAHVEAVRQRLSSVFFFMTRGLGVMNTSLVELAPAPVLQNPDVRAGVDFLLRAQRDGGAFVDDERTAVRDTASAVEALAGFRGEPAVASARRLALGFLDGGVPGELDAWSRRGRALIDLAAPKALQGAAPTGAARGYKRTPLDIALYMQFLLDDGRLDAAAPEVAELLSLQLPSGAFPATTGGAGAIEATARAVTVLARLPGKGVREDDAVARGVAYLRSQSRRTGLFGDTAESVVATGLAVSAMATAGRLTATEALAARDALLSTQLQDGSWNHRVQDTAQAVQALARVLVPNIAVEGFSLSRASVAIGERFSATVVVRNTGYVPSAATTLALVTETGSPVAQSAALPALAPGATQTFVVFASVDAGPPRAVPISAIADPTGTAPDSNPADNMRSASVVVTAPPAGPDPAVLPGAISFLPGEVSRLPQTLTVSVGVANYGAVAASNVSVSVVGAGVSGSAVVAIAAGASLIVPVTAQVSNSAPLSGIPVAVRVSGTGDTVVENNETSAIIPVRAETAVALASAVLTSSSIEQGQDAELVVTVRNDGTSPASGVIRVDVLAAGGASIAVLPASPIAVGVAAATTRAFRWRASQSGSYTLVARVDVAGDASGGDDERLAPVVVRASTRPNLRTGAGDITVSPAEPLAGAAMTVTARVTNGGSFDVGAFEVVLANASTGVELGRETVAALAAGSSTTLSRSFTPRNGSAVELVFRVDSMSAIDEFNEEDNVAALTVRPISLGDLSVTAAALTVSPAFPRTSEATTVSVVITNQGGQATTASDVELQVDGVRVGIEALPAISPGVSVTRQFAWTAPSQEGSSTLGVIVDPRGVLEEESEANNRASRAVRTQDGAFALTELYISPNGDQVKDVTRIRVDGAADASVEARVVDARGAGVWTGPLSGAGALKEASWDGRSDGGVLVDDGRYTVIVTQAGAEVGRREVVVDTNRSSWLDAVDAGQLAVRSLNRGVQVWEPVVPAGKGRVVFVGSTAPHSTCSLYIQDVLSGAPARLVPQQWPCFARPREMGVLPDGRLVVLFTSPAPRVEVLDPVTGLSSLLVDGASLGWFASTSESDAPPGLSLAAGPLPRIVVRGPGDVREVQLNGTSQSLVEGAALPQPQFVCVLDAGVCPDERGGRWPADRLRARATSLVLAPGGSSAWVNGESLLWTGAPGTPGRIILPSPQLQTSSPDRGPRVAAFGPDTFVVAAFELVPDSSFTSGTRRSHGLFVVNSASGLRPLFVPENGIPAALPPTLASIGTVVAFPYTSLDERSRRYSIRGFQESFPTHRNLWLAAEGRAPVLVAAASPSPNPLEDFAFLAWAFDESALVFRTNFTNYGVGNPAPQYRGIVSTANLALQVSGFKSPAGGLRFVGTAQDENFDSYTIEVRRAGTQEPFSLVLSGSSAIVDGAFGDWLPPTPGLYEARLTGTDKAGNRKETTSVLGWSATPALASVVVPSPEFSPNGDGRKDSVEIRYSLSVAHSTNFVISNQSATLVRQLPQTQTSAGAYSLSWDGRDELGAPLPDGTYTLVAEAQTARLTVDTVAPAVSLAVTPPALADVRATTTQGTPITYKGFTSLATWAAPDLNFERALLTTADGGVQLRSETQPDGSTPLQPWELSRGPLVLTASDTAGNVSSATATVVDRVELAALGARSRLDGAGGLLTPAGVLPRLDLLTPATNETLFVPQVWVFSLASTVMGGFAGYEMAWRRRGASTAFNVDVGLTEAAPGVVEWDARAVPPQELDVELRATARDGRVFVVPFSFRIRVLAGELVSCLSPGQRLTVGLRADLPPGASDTLTPSRVLLSEGSTTTQRVALPSAPTSLVGRRATWTGGAATVSACRVGLRAEATTTTGETLLAEDSDVPTCHIWPDELGVGADSVTVGIASSPVLTTGSYDILARPAGGSWRLVATAPAAAGRRVGVPFGAFGGCGQFDVRVLGHQAGVSELDSLNNVSICAPGPTSIRVPCALVAVAHEPAPPTPAVDCAVSLPSSVRIEARTDAPGGFTGLTARLEALDGTRLASLPVLGFTPGQLVVSAAAAVEFQGEGQFLVVAEGVESSGRVIVGRSAPFAIDRAAPFVSLNPLPATVCEGGTVAVSGFVTDRSLVSWSVSVADQPGVFSAAQTRSAASPSATVGTTASLAAAAGGTAYVRLAARDVAGNSGCADARAVRVVGRASFVSAFTLPLAVSPDGDGQFDTSDVSFAVSESATVDVDLLDSAGQLVRAVTSVSAPAGVTVRAPLGSLSALSEGRSRVRLRARTTACALDSTTEVPLLVDFTPPVVRIDAPAEGETVFGNVAVLGEVADATLSSFELEVGAGAAPSTWTAIASGSVSPGPRLGSFDARALGNGPFTLRLTARDATGHVTVTRRLVTVNAGALLGSLTVRDPVVSPNADGRLDSTGVEGELLAAADLRVELVGPSGTLNVRPRSPAPAGAFSLSLTEAFLSGAGEGEFEIRAIAEAGASTETLRTRLRIDTTAPAVAIRAPGATHVRPEAPVDIRVSGAASWSVEQVASAQSSRLVASGTTDVDGVVGRLEGPDGLVELVLRAEDAAGNRAERRLGVTVDGAPPRVVVLKPTGDVRGQVPVELEVTEASLARVEVFELNPARRLLLAATSLGPDGGVGTFDSRLRSDGPLDLEVVVEDTAGNSTRVTSSVLVDNTAPLATLTSPTGSILVSELAFLGSVDDSRLAQWELSYGVAGDTTFVPLASGTTSVLSGLLASPVSLAPGGWEFVLSARDFAGNTSVSRTVATLRASGPPPVGPQPRVVAPPGSVLVTRTGARELLVSWAPSPSSNIVQYLVRRNTLEVARGPGLSLRDTALSDGTYRYDVVALDDTGRASQPASAIGLIDTAAPIVSIFQPGPGARVGGRVVVNGAAQSADGFLGYVLEAGEGSAPAVWRPLAASLTPVSGALGGFDTTGLVEGSTHTLRLSAESIHGGRAETTVAVSVDNVAPSAPVLLSATASGSAVTLAWQAVTAPDLRGYLVLRNDEVANAPRGTSVSDVSLWLIPPGTATFVDAAPDGTHQYVVLAVDEASNFSARSNVRTATVETRGPSVRISSPLPNALVTVPETLFIDTEDFDVASVRFERRLAGGAWALLGVSTTAPFGWAFDPRPLAPGTIEVRATGTDLSGNQGPPSAAVALRVEGSILPLGVTASDDGASSVTLRWTPQGPTVSRYEVHAGAGNLATVLPPATSVVLPLRQAGAVTFTVEAVSFHGARRAESVTVTRYVLQADVLPAEVGVMPTLVTGRGAPPGARVSVREGGAELGVATADATGGFAISARYAVGTAPFATLEAVSGASRTAPVFVVLPLFRRATNAAISLVQRAGIGGAPEFTIGFTAGSTQDFSQGVLLRDGQEVDVRGPADVLVDPTAGFDSYVYTAEVRGADVRPVASQPLQVDLRTSLVLSLVSAEGATPLEFSFSASNASVFDQVQLRRRDETGQTVVVTSAASAPLVDASPILGVTEYFVVPERTSSGVTGAPSAAVVVTRAGALPAVSGLSATPGVSQTVTLSWTPVPGATRYDVSRASGAPARTTRTSFLDAIGPGLTRFRVRAVDGLGNVSAWAFVDVRVPALAPVLEPLPSAQVSSSPVVVAGYEFGRQRVEALEAGAPVASAAAPAFPNSRIELVRSSFQDDGRAPSSRPVLSPTGRHVAFVPVGSATEVAVVALCDGASCGSPPVLLSDGLAVSGTMRFSADGRTLFVGSADGVLVADVEAGQTSRLVSSSTGPVLAASPNGSRVAHGDPLLGVVFEDLAANVFSVRPLAVDEVLAELAFGDEDTLYVLIRATGQSSLERCTSLGGGATCAQVATASDLSGLSVSATSRFAVSSFDGTEWTLVTDLPFSPVGPPPSATAFLASIAPEGTAIAWLDGTSLWAESANGQKQLSTPAALTELLWSLGNPWSWFDDGTGEAPVRLIESQSFELSVPLRAGVNRLSIRSIVDGVNGASSADFEVDLRGSPPAVTDFSVSSVQLNPRMPSAASSAVARVEVVAQSTGPSVPAVPLRVSVVGAVTRSTFVSVPLTATAPGRLSGAVFVPLNLAGLVGPNTLVVVADPNATLPDSNRANNVLTVPFTVAPASSPTATVTATLTGNQLAIASRVFNPGTAATLTVRLAVESAAGAVVLRAADEVVQAAATSVHDFSRTFDVSALPSGDYVVTASVFTGASLLSVTREPLRIARSPAASVRFAPASLVFGRTQAPRFTAWVDNLSQTDSLVGAALDVVVRTDAGVEQVALSLAVPVTAPLSTSSLGVQLAPGALAVGAYEAEATVVASGTRLSTDVARFEVVGTPRLTGTLLVRGGNPVVRGAPVEVDAELRNEGPVALEGVSATVTLLDGLSGTPVDTEPLTVGTLAAGASRTVTATVGPTTLLRPYALVLSGQFDGGVPEQLASTSLSVVDGAGPQLVLEGPAAGRSHRLPLGVRVTARDEMGVATVRAAIDGAPPVALQLVSGTPVFGAWEAQFAALTQGPHSVSIEALDTAGQTSVLGPVTFDVDTTPPTLVISGVNDGDRLSTPPVVTYVATGAVSLRATLNGTPFASGTLVSDGFHTLVVEAIDAAGNATTRTMRFTVDSRGPVIQLTAPAEGSSVPPPASVAYVVIDTTATTVAATVNGVPFVDATGITAIGPVVVVVQATDALGNASLVTRRFVVATASLGISISGVSDGQQTQGPVTPVITVSGATVSTVTLNGAPFVSGSVVSAEGSYVLSVTASDGTQTQTRQVSFVIDRTAPALFVSGVADGAVVRGPVVLQFSATDVALSSSTATLDGLPVVTGAVVVAEGQHVFVLTAVDGAGNRSTDTRRFVIDDTSPVVGITGVFDGEVANTSVTPVITVTDANPGLVVITLDGAPFASGATVLTEGPHRLRVVATDLAGNQAVVDWAFTIDTTPPVVAVTGVAEGASVRGPVQLDFTASDVRLVSVIATLDGAPVISGVVVSVEGPHTLRIEARDAANNVTVVSRAFTIDTTPPVLSIQGVFDGLESPVDVTPIVTAVGAVSLTLTLDGAPFASGTLVSAEGPHLLRAEAVDAAGNSALATVAFDVDKTPPVLSLLGVANGAFLAGGVTLTFSATDRRLVTVSSVLDGASFAGGLVSDEGPHFWRVEAVDAAGNRSVEERRFVIDLTPPSIAVSGVSDGAVTSGNVALVFSASDANLASVVASLNGVPFSSGDVVSTEGPYELAVSAVDRAGRQAQRTVRFRIDRTPPVLDLRGVVDGAFVNQSVTLTFSARDESLVTLTSTVDGFAFVSGDTVSSEGAHLWLVTATDEAGNTATSSRRFTIDVTPPTVTITGVTQDEVRRTAVTPVVTATGASSVVVTLNGAPYASGTPVTLDGRYTLAATATDAAGNSASATVDFTVDTLPPVIVIAGVAEGAIIQGPVNLSFSASDADAVRTLEGRLDGVVVSSPVSVSAEGPHRLSVDATDRAGNAATATRAFTLDRTPPVIALSGVADGQVSTTPVTPVFSAQDANAATVSATLNGQPFVSGTTVVSAGQWLLVVTATDAAQNVTTRSVAFSITSPSGATVCREPRLTAIRRNSSGVVWDANLSPAPALRFALPSEVSLQGGSAQSDVRLTVGSGPAAFTCRYVGGPARAVLQSCTGGQSAGSIVTATSLRLTVAVGGPASTTEATVQVLEVQPCAGAKMVPSFHYALCAFGGVSGRGSAEVEGSVAANGEVDLRGNVEVEGDVVAGAGYLQTGSAEVEGRVYSGGPVSLTCAPGCGRRQCPPVQAVTPAPQPCECGYDVVARLAEAQANNDNQLIASSSLSAFLSNGAFSARNATVRLRAGRYFFTAFALRNVRVEIGAGESVELFVAGTVEVDSSSRIQGDGRLLIVSGASPPSSRVVFRADRAKLQLYAPFADVTLERGRIDGAMVVRDAVLQGNFELELSPGRQQSPPPLSCP